MNPKLNELIRFALPIRTQRAHPSPYLCLLALALAAGLPSFAANPITVTSTSDSGPGSLRAAIAAAASGATINFNLQLPAIITLATTLSICNLQNLTISGPAVSSQLAINGNGAVQVFNICSGASVTISGLTIENGTAAGAPAAVSSISAPSRSSTARFLPTLPAAVVEFTTLVRSPS